MLIYLDSENKCHIEKTEGFQEVLAPEIFKGKCRTFIEGFKYFPIGTINYNGETYGNGNYYPWRALALLNEFQAQYEAQLAATEAAYEEGVNSI